MAVPIGHFTACEIGPLAVELKVGCCLEKGNILLLLEV
jgi:hypothetical protein